MLVHRLAERSLAQLGQSVCAPLLCIFDANLLSECLTYDHIPLSCLFLYEIFDFIDLLAPSVHVTMSCFYKSSDKSSICTICYQRSTRTPCYTFMKSSFMKSKISSTKGAFISVCAPLVTNRTNLAPYDRRS